MSVQRGRLCLRRVTLAIKKVPLRDRRFFLKNVPGARYHNSYYFEGGVEENPQRERIPAHSARRSAFIFRFQSHATITIPTSKSMNVVAAVSTGDFRDGIMIGE